MHGSIWSVGVSTLLEGLDWNFNWDKVTDVGVIQFSTLHARFNNLVSWLKFEIWTGVDFRLGGEHIKFINSNGWIESETSTILYNMNETSRKLVVMNFSM